MVSQEARELAAGGVGQDFEGWAENGNLAKREREVEKRAQKNASHKVSG